MAMDKLDYLSDNEAKALLNAASGIRDRAIITLFLDTGIFLNELADLNIDSVDWKKKLLHIKGSRKRNIPLSDEAYTVLVDWSKERPDCKSDALFITQKGEINRISPRNTDRLIRKYAVDAGIGKNVNAKVLRHTFAVRFLKKETDIANACYILAVKSSRALQKYFQAAKEGAAPAGAGLEHLDTRPPIVRQLSKLIPRKHKEARVLVVPAKVGEQEITVGREAEISQVKDNLRKGIDTILCSGPGLGKTHLLKHIAKEDNYLYISSPAPAKELIGELCQKYSTEQEKTTKARSSAKEMLAALFKALEKQEKKDIIVIDSLDRLKKSDIDTFTALLDKFTILGAADEMPERLKQIWWKMKRIDLEPLSDEATKALIKHLTEGLVIDNYQLLETQISSRAFGDPLAVVEMINQIKGLPRVRENDIRELHHEAGTKYIEVKSLVIVLWLLAIGYRFISLGTHSFENYILAGFFVTFAVGLRMFMRRA